MLTQKTLGLRDLLKGGTHGDDLSTSHRKGCLVQNRPETNESPFGASDAMVLDERTRILPITEPNAIVIGASPEVEDNSQNNQP